VCPQRTPVVAKLRRVVSEEDEAVVERPWLHADCCVCSTA
jgi:hypothetical protein